MTTSRRRSGPVRRATTGTAGLVLLTALTLAGCGGDDSEGGPDPAPSSSGATESTEPSDTTSESPSVTAATGLKVDIRTVSLNGPEGWVRLSDRFSNLGRGVRPPAGNALVALYSIPSLNPDGTLDELTAAIKKTSTFEGKLQVQDPVTIDGVECYHITGTATDGQDIEQFGAVHAGDQVDITFLFDKDFPEADRQGTLDSVLASVVWS